MEWHGKDRTRLVGQERRGASGRVVDGTGRDGIGWHG
jgi:hypothetical protein